MPRLKYLASARDDLVDIFSYVATTGGDIDVGRRVVGMLRGKCAELAALPGRIGRPRPELRPDIRSFPFKGYVIFFRYADDTFEVVDILERHRDVGPHFSDED
ncbi:type II toxin-antitoxin system RelE/ParE family toxin [Methylobrevis pamukkalensis]|uniref:Plasmid stabilization system protein n=1 Tax=Methylobrevis pamukkalensis TaxID=1439726 RepID=A0A1E3H0B0_9HYPH|nr:type II toxin-antitoxin system RelE/ParE family toxin [Methylobrevis pamukkalensis]ODN69753.1 Plasmid stabilization system protein [Methylobrevis pamukkalensis]